jgi:hexosaminidase
MRIALLLLALTAASFATAQAVVPQPKSISFGTKPLACEGPITCSDASLLPHARVLAEELRSLDGQKRTVKVGAMGAGIHLALNPAHKGEGYRVRGRQIDAGTAAGVAWGSSALLQAYPRSVTIDDAPDHPYRGVLVDVARKWHSIDTLKQVVNLCRFYRVRYLQLHLTDDQAFTFRSRAFPELAMYNQHGGRSYTRRELEELVAYADARGVTIVPEIDVPGHSAILVKARPDLFKIAGTQPYEHHATINFAKPEAVGAVAEIIEEMCEVFKSSPYFHIGGDEADYSLADQNAEFQQSFRELGLEGAAQHELYRRFLIQMNEVVKKNGKQTIIWEGFAREPGSKFPIPKDILVMEFESAYYLPLELLQDGYTVINAAWTPLYVVNRHRWPARKVFDWKPTQFSRFGDVWKTITTFEAEPTNQIIGAQFCAWEQPEYREMESLIDSVPAMSERLWGSTASWGDFARRAAEAKKRFCLLYQPVELNAKGLTEPGPDDFAGSAFYDAAEVRASSLRPGFIRYTTDESPVTASSPIMPATLKLDKTTVVRAALFTARGARIGGETGVTFYRDARPTDNLARGKSVTSSGGTQGAQTPDLAVDGRLELGSSWWAGPWPQWLQVDLEKVTEIGAVTVYPYWDGSRYYQYKVEGSEDGFSWALLLDRSGNTVPASLAGDRVEIRTRVRFVRVTMLKNTANEGVHLVELVVEGAK